MSRQKKHQGNWGEGIAARELEKRGFRLLAKNERLFARVEVDLLVQKESKLWLVEVKTQRLASCPQLITKAQLERLRRLALRVSRSCPSIGVGLLLIWVSPDTGEVEFLENP